MRIIELGLGGVTVRAAEVGKQAFEQLMDRYDLDYAGYGFAAHKGYGVAAHLAALQASGPCPIHRFTFAPLARRPVQLELCSHG